MADENSTPVWTTQASTSSWNDDFVLDFWDLENKEKNIVEEIKSDENENNGVDNADQGEQWGIELDFDENNIFENHEEKGEEVDTQNLDAKDQEQVNDEFDISMDDSTSSLASLEDSASVDNSEWTVSLDEGIKEYVSNLSQEDSNEGDVVQINNEIEQPSDENIQISDENMQVEPKELSSNTEDVHTDELINLQNGGEVENLKEDDLNETKNSDETSSQIEFVGNWSVDGGVSIDNREQKPEDTVETEVADADVLKLENDVVQDSNEQENIFKTDDEVYGDNYNSSVDDVPKYDNQSDWVNVNDSASENVSKVSELLEDGGLWSQTMNDGNVKQTESENVDFVMDFNPEDNKKNDLGTDMQENVENNVNMQQVNQPEIWDLLWDNVVDSEWNKEVVNENNLGEGSEISENAMDVSDWQDKNVVIQDYTQNLDQWQNNSDLLLDNTGLNNGKSLVGESESVVNSENDVTNTLNEQVQPSISQYLENADQVNVLSIDNKGESAILEWENNQINTENVVVDSQPVVQQQADVELTATSDNNQNNVVEDLKGDEDNSENLIVKPTLSLDQILDSELNNNPEYSDNSKSVPTNVSTKKWLFANNKAVWIVAWILLFLLAWFVAVLAFPNKNTERKVWDVVEYTEDQTGDVEHDSADSQNLLEEIVGGMEEDDSTSNGRTSIIQEFPEVEGEDSFDLDQYDLEMNSWEPEPYVCNWSECGGELDEMDLKNVTTEKVESIILNLKSEAEQYYTLWDESQDKKLVKYASQLIYLCDSYKEQIGDDEEIDNESFEDFKTNAESILSKISKYTGWSESVEIFEPNS